jgi:hypothetical protein
VNQAVFAPLGPHAAQPSEIATDLGERSRPSAYQAYARAFAAAATASVDIRCWS